MVRLSLFILLLVYAHTNAQSASPLVEGSLFVSVSQGVLRGQVCVADLPKGRITIALNKFYRASFWADSLATREVRVRKVNTKSEVALYEFLSETVVFIRFEGRFTVHHKTSLIRAYGDWKGNIAFNGETLRASEQSQWYPSLYDPASSLPDPFVRYNLQIKSDEPISCYISGNAPARGESFVLSSDSPYPLMLFAGRFDISKGDNYFLNTRLNKTQQRSIDSWMTRIKHVLSNRLAVPYNDPIDIIETSPVSELNSWAFFTYPAIVFINHNGGLLNRIDDSGNLKDSVETLEFLSHELSHYYFGYRMRPNSTLRWALLEGIPSYLSIKIVGDLLGKQKAAEVIEVYRRRVAKMKEVPVLSEVKNPSAINVDYRYYYFPLILLCLEEQMGEAFMMRWLQQLLSKPVSETNYMFFRSSLISAGMTASEWLKFEQNHILNKQSLQVVLQSTLNK